MAGSLGGAAVVKTKGEDEDGNASVTVLAFAGFTETRGNECHICVVLYSHSGTSCSRLCLSIEVPPLSLGSGPLLTAGGGPSYEVPDPAEDVELDGWFRGIVVVLCKNYFSAMQLYRKDGIWQRKKN